jgi:hypothetical protein
MVKMQIETLPEKNTKVLEWLNIYRFLTVPQLQRLGLDGSKESVYKVLRRFNTNRKPLVAYTDFGFIPKIGRLHRIFYLTKYGALALAELLRIEIDKINYPKNTKLFHRDYFHRLNMIDFHIELRLWSKQTDTKIILFDTYFEGLKQKNKRFEMKTKVYLKDGLLIPDAIFIFHLPNTKTYLYALEIHNGFGTKRIVNQLEKHLIAIKEGSVSEKYAYSYANRVVSVFDNEATLRAVLKRLKELPDFKKFYSHFLFKTLEQLKNNFYSGWFVISGGNSNFVKITH